MLRFSQLVLKGMLLTTKQRPAVVCPTNPDYLNHAEHQSKQKEKNANLVSPEQIQLIILKALMATLLIFFKITAII